MLYHCRNSCNDIVFNSTMKQAKIWAILALAVFANTQAQNYLNYNVGNAHSHNDYMQEIPFGRHIMLILAL